METVGKLQQMKSFRRIAFALTFLTVTALLAVFLVYVSETLVKTKLCLDLRRSSISKLVCHPTDSYSELLRGSFHVGVTTRVQVRTMLSEYWVASGELSDTYEFNAFFLPGEAVFIFDEDNVLRDFQVKE